MDACTGLLRPDREFVDIQTRSRIPPKPYVRRLSKANKQRKRNRQIIAEYGKNRGIDRTCPDRSDCSYRASSGHGHLPRQGFLFAALAPVTNLSRRTSRSVRSQHSPLHLSEQPL